MKYKEIIAKAREEGIAGEQTMNVGISLVDGLLELIREEHPDTYWKFMRDTHMSIYGPHYCDMFAGHDVSKLRYADSDGRVHEGAHWTSDEVEKAMSKFRFNDEVNRWDRYVAANAMYADLCKKFDEEDIIEATYLFFFDDYDWPDSGKIWHYMNR